MYALVASNSSPMQGLILQAMILMEQQAKRSMGDWSVLLPKPQLGTGRAALEATAVTAAVKQMMNRQAIHPTSAAQHPPASCSDI